MRSEHLFIFLAAVWMCRCADDPAPPEPSPPPRSGMSSTMAHGDHSPHHGGQVFMHGDLHFETVLDPEGRHRVYFSDAMRVELPASVASDVAITVLRPDGEPELLELVIDEYGESWVASGRPVGDLESRALVRFVFEPVDNAPYEIELPFLPEPIDPEAPDPHQSTPH